MARSHSITPFLNFVLVAGDLRRNNQNQRNANGNLESDLEAFATFLETHNRYIRKSVSRISLEPQNNNADCYHLI
jgi:hypothetical protein